MLVATHDFANVNVSEWKPLDRRAIVKIIYRLNKVYGYEEYARRKSDPFRVLVGVILSHQTTDEISHPAAERLFKYAKTPRQFAKLGVKKVDALIKNVNYHPTKARRIVAISEMLIKNFGGKVPMTREELMELPGVGGKSADIVLSYGFDIPTIAVDTHVLTISQRLHLTKNKDAEKIHHDLHRVVPKKYWLQVNSLFVDFGKEICSSPKPKCYKCQIVHLCPYESKNMLNV
jgi:endonuclease-3